MRAVIYCRVSSPRQVENLSLATQERICRQFCEREGFDVDRVFVEEGQSAKTADRPRLQELIEYCRKNKKSVQAVIVYDLSRFARATRVHQAVRYALQRVGVELRSATQQFDDSPSGKFMENVLSAVAQFDNDERAARTTEGMKAALRKGRWTFQPPIGYRKPLGGRALPSLEPDPELAPLVKRAFDLVTTRSLTLREVLREVTSLGLSTRRGHSMSGQSFGYLLRNPVYAGRIVVAKWEIDSKGDFDPIVSSKTYAAVQELLGGRGNSLARRCRDHPDFPLRRLVLCGNCGKPLTGSWSSGRSARYGYYRCRDGACGVNVRKEELEEAFYGSLRELAVDPGVLRLFEEIVRDVCKQQDGAAADRRALLERRSGELEGRERRLVEAHLYEGKIDSDTFARLHQKLTNDMDEIHLQLADARAAQLEVDEILHFARSILQDPAGFWDRAAPKDRARLQNAIYPNGLRFQDGLIGTAHTSLAFRYLGEIESQKEEMVTPTGLEPVLPP